MPSANLSIFLRHKIEKFQRDSEHSCKPQQPSRARLRGERLGASPSPAPPFSPRPPGVPECSWRVCPGSVPRVSSQGAQPGSPSEVQPHVQAKPDAHFNAAVIV